jgi:hypothetical protein
MTGLHSMRLFKLLSIALLCSACLDRSDTEAVGYSSFVLESNVEVRPLERNMDAKLKLDANDGLNTGTIPLHTGYAGGKEVRYWDLGTSLATAEPIWIFLRHLGDGSEVVEHPPLIDSIPGDTVYSPMRYIFEVYVTPKWARQKFPSLRALEDGVELGLLEEPKAIDFFTNCVVSLKDNVLEGPEGKKFMPTEVYYRGKSVYQFCVGDLMGNAGQFPTKMAAPVFGNAFLVRRENDVSPLDETALKTDLNGDGDMLDSNVVFDSTVGDTGYTSVWKNLDVVVDKDYEFGAAKGQEDLFKKMPWGLQANHPPVIEFKDTTTIINRPILPESAP